MTRSPEDALARESLTHWVLGLVVGAIGGIAPLVLGTLGVVLAAPVVLWAVLDRPRGAAFGGALVGIGATWLAVWGRAFQACAGPNTATDGCVGPDLAGLIAVPIIVLAAGGLVSFVAAMRLPRRGQPAPANDPEQDDKD
jgi:hypothetical protein